MYQQEPPLLDETSNLNIFGMNNECLAQLAADWLEKHGVRGFFSGSTQLAVSGFLQAAKAKYFRP